MLRIYVANHRSETHDTFMHSTGTDQWELTDFTSSATY